MKMTQALMDELTAQLKALSRLRMNMDLRNHPEDKSQRMLNAIESKSVLPIHWHQKTLETVVSYDILKPFFYYCFERIIPEFLLKSIVFPIISVSDYPISEIENNK